MIGNRKEEGRVCSTLLEKAPLSMRIDQQQFWTEKSLSPSWDSNPACPVRMASLYHLCHHHCLEVPVILISKKLLRKQTYLQTREEPFLKKIFQHFPLVFFLSFKLLFFSRFCLTFMQQNINNRFREEEREREGERERREKELGRERGERVFDC